MAFAGLRVVITGGTGGIGLEISKEFLKAGASVSVISKNIESINKTIYKLNKWKKVAGFQCDVTKPNIVKEVFKQIGDIDILV